MLPSSTRRTRIRRSLGALPAVAALLAGCAGAPTAGQTESPTASAASAGPVTVENCGEKVTVTRPPSKLVTLNQGATEVALALGLQDRMAGTAYIDDAVSPRWKSAYDSVKVLSEKYPTKEQFLAAAPDFAYASYGSAFTDKAVGTRAELKKGGINTYVSPFGCPEGTPIADPTFESGWSEISDVAKLFAVPDRAEQVIAEQKKELTAVQTAAAGKGLKIFWYDSNDKTPFVGAGGGGPQLIIDAVGATNVFADLKQGWADGSWEKVVAAQPDVIVFADAAWDSAKKKQDYLAADPTLSKLEAVRDKRFVTLPFSETTPGVRLVDGAASVSKQIAALPAQ